MKIVSINPTTNKKQVKPNFKALDVSPSVLKELGKTKEELLRYPNIQKFSQKHKVILDNSLFNDICRVIVMRDYKRPLGLFDVKCNVEEIENVLNKCNLSQNKGV